MQLPHLILATQNCETNKTALYLHLHSQTGIRCRANENRAQTISEEHRNYQAGVYISNGLHLTEILISSS